MRLGTGLFTGPPLYVWISNQLGNTGVLIGEVLVDNTTAFPFNTNPDKYKPANVTGAGANSFELNVTDPDFKFPQVWRTNLAVDHRLPGGVTGTVEFLYNKDVNGMYYINANLPAAQTTFSGVDARPRWTANRINNTAPQRHHERVRPEEPGHRHIVEPVGQPVEDAVARPVAPRRVQLR